METIKQTTKEYFRTLSIVHLALLIGPILFGIIISILIFQNVILNGPDELYKILLSVVSAFYAIGLTINPYIFRSKLVSIKNNPDLGHKISNYRGALITRYAIIEGLAFFALVATLLTFQFIFLAYAGFSILFLFYLKPSKDNLIADLQLDRDEIDIINNPDSVISMVVESVGY